MPAASAHAATPSAPSAADPAAILERLRALAATVSHFNRQHYERQFTQCFARYGATVEESRTNIDRRGTNHSIGNKRGRSAVDKEGAASSYSAQSFPRRKAAIIHDLHLVGVCADHDTDASSCDEAESRERGRARQNITKIRSEAAAEEASNKTQAASVTNAGSAAIAAGIQVTSGQMNQIAKEVAQQSLTLSEKFVLRQRAVEEASRRRLKSIIDRRATKRCIEQGMYKALHTPPLLLQKRQRGRRTNATTSSGTNASVTTNVGDVQNFKLSDWASVRASERAEHSGVPQSVQLDAAVDRHKARMKQLQRLRQQADFQEANSAEKAKIELSAVMKKRKDFHRARAGAGSGAMGGVGSDAFYEDNDDNDNDE